MTASNRQPASRPGRAVRARAGRADLPDLGADLRVQSGVRALPVVVGQTRSARAVHPPVQGHHRRAGTHAGVLRQHRRRGTHCAPGLLGAGGLRHRTPRRREVLHQRGPDHPRGRGPVGGQRLRGRPDLARRRDRRGQRRRPRAPGPSRWRCARWRIWPRPASPTPRSPSSSPGTTSTSSTNSPRWQTVTAPPCGSPGCGRRAAAPTSGMTCTPPPTSRSSSTTGWSPRASGC